MQSGTSTFAGQPSLPPALPFIANHRRTLSAESNNADNRYSNQYMAAGRRDPAPSRRTSYASAQSHLPTPAAPNNPAAVPQIPMSFSGGRDQPSPFAMPAFPVDVDEGVPVEDAYGGLVEESEDESPNGHNRRASEVDLVVTRDRSGKGSLKRKPVPQA